MFSLDIYLSYTRQHNTEFVKRNRGRMTSKPAMSISENAVFYVVICSNL